MSVPKIVRPDRALPPELDMEAQKIESEGWVQYLMRRFQKAEEFYQQDLDLRIKFQEETKRPVHKGAPLHMLGICSLYQMHIEDCIRFFLLAYAEDTLNTEYDEEDEADRAPAATALRDTVVIRMRVFRETKAVSRELKMKKWNEAGDPNEILGPALGKMRLSLERPAELKNPNVMVRLLEKTPLGFPQPPAFRVFIGGKYGDSDAIIEKIREVVIRLGFTPVVARDVDTPREKTHDFAARLLHTCDFGIFDMTFLGGQYMEIERATDYDVKMLLIGKKDSPISTMARTAPGVKGILEYEAIDEINEEEISKFLVSDIT